MHISCRSLPNHLETSKSKKKSFQDVEECWFNRENFLMVHARNQSQTISFQSPIMLLLLLLLKWFLFIGGIVGCKQKATPWTGFSINFEPLFALNYFFSQTNFCRSRICLPSTVLTIDAQTRLGKNETIRKNVYQGIEIGQGRQAAKLLYALSFLLCTSKISRNIHNQEMSLTSVDVSACCRIN